MPSSHLKPANILSVAARQENAFAFPEIQAAGQCVVVPAAAADASGLTGELKPAAAIIDAADLGFASALELGRQLREAGDGLLPTIILVPETPTAEMIDRAARAQIADVLAWPAGAALLEAKIGLYTEFHRRAETGPPEDRYIDRGEWLKQFVNAATDYALFFIDPRGRVVDWMPGAEGIFGHKREQVMGRDASFIFTPTDRRNGVPEKEMATARREGRAKDERWHMRADGSRFFAEGRLVTLRSPDERVFGFVKIVRDFTSQKETDQRLRGALERLNLAIETTGIGIWELDLTSGQPAWSDQARRTLSLAGGEQVDVAALLNKIHPDDQDEVRRAFERTERQAFGESIETTFRLTTSQRGVRWIALRAFPVRSGSSGDFERLLGTVTDVTEQRVAEESLRASLEEVRLAQQAAEQSNRLYRELFETAHEGIWMVNLEGRIDLVNQSMAEMLGYEVDEMVGRPPSDFGFEEDPSRLQGPLRPDPGGATSSDVRFRHRDGRQVWALRTARRQVRDGRVAGALDMFTDITERRAAEEALRTSEEQFRTFFESSAAGHAIIDPATQCFLRVNLRFGEITGYHPEELIGVAAASVVHPDDRPTELRLMEQLKQDGVDEVSIEKRCVSKDGRVVWVHQTLALLRDGEGKALRQIGVLQDITARKAAESELRESQAQLELAVEAAQLGTYFYDHSTGRQKWNARAKQLMGLPADAVESIERFGDALHPEDRARVLSTIEETFAIPEDSVYRIFYRVVWPDGSIRHIMATGRTVWETQPDGTRTVRLLGTTQDVTEAKHSEEQLQRKVAERTHALEDKTAQLERFSYTVAHDLRSPLRAISGYADFVKEDLGAEASPVVAGYVERIKAAARRLDLLINDLLAYSQISQVDVVLDVLSLDEVFERVLARLTGEIEEHQARVTLPDDLPSVLAERAMLDIVFGNLISNALKFMEPGVQPDVRVEVEDRGEKVRVIIADNGIGVPEAYHERIFGMFERLRQSQPYPGTGVGLAIVEKAVQRIGGKVDVESQPGKGSRFWVELNKPQS